MKRDHLYVDRKNLLVWLSALCMLASAVTAAFLMLPYCSWWITAVAVYLVILLLSGDELLYRTAVPIWVLGLSVAFDGGTILIWIGALAFCISYTVIVSGRIKKGWLIPCQLAAIVCAVCFHGLPLTLAATGLLLLCPAMKVHNDGKYIPPGVIALRDGVYAQPLLWNRLLPTSCQTGTVPTICSLNPWKSQNWNGMSAANAGKD